MAAHGRHRDILGFLEGLLGGAVDHIGHHLELLGGELEALPGGHKLHQGACEVASQDAEGKEFAHAELVLND